MGLTLSAAVALVVLCCNNQPDVPLPPPTAPPGQVPPPMTPPGMPPTPGVQPPGVQPPVAPPVEPPTPVAEAPLPRTELIPISEEVDEPEPKKTVKGGTGICKLPGPETPGDELLGNYTCAFNVKGLPFGLTPPPIGCSIGRNQKADGSLVLRGSGSGDAKIRAPIAEHKASGFRIDGKYKFSGNGLTIGSCMKRKGAGKFVGSGTGVLNKDKKNKVKYTLTMTKK
jgi:hypothetical protein